MHFLVYFHFLVNANIGLNSETNENKQLFFIRRNKEFLLLTACMVIKQRKAFYNATGIVTPQCLYQNKACAIHMHVESHCKIIVRHVICTLIINKLYVHTKTKTNVAIVFLIPIGTAHSRCDCCQW